MERDGTRRLLPGLPWRWGDDSLIDHRPAPGQGQDTESVLQRVGGLSTLEVGVLEAAGAFGKPGEQAVEAAARVRVDG